MHLEASTKPHVHNLIHEFLINMAFSMAYLNFKKGLKMVSGPLGVNDKAHIRLHYWLLSPPIHKTMVFLPWTILHLNTIFIKSACAM
jgi:hypothetical protein